VTSPTAVVFPIERLVAELGQRGIDTLVDGAHAPGMVPLALDRLGAAYYTGNLHKWVCTPKGAAFLHVRKDRQAAIQPPILSHGFNRPRPGYTRFQDAFDWPGTGDPTAWLCLAAALDFLAGLLDGGIDALMRRNHRSAVAARRLLCQRLHLRGVCPEEMLGSMAAVCLPDKPQAAGETSDLHPLGRELLDRFGIEVPVMCWPAPPRVLLRISAQAYNHPGQYENLADALQTLLGEP
jgi:isopenicillin-N epimerase